MAAPEEPRDYCPTCGVAYEPLQEYCLECGARLPTNRGVVGVLATAWQRRLAWYPGDWIWPVLLFLVLTVVATAAAVAAGSTHGHAAATIVATNPRVTVGPGAPQTTVPTVVRTSTLPTAPQPTISTGTLPRPPGSISTSSVTTPTPNPNALAVWPAGKSGFTNVLESLPESSGKANALARARAAKRAGLPAVGVLVSSQLFEPPPRLLRRLLGDLRLAEPGERRARRRPREGLPERLSGPRHPLSRREV